MTKCSEKKLLFLCPATIPLNSGAGRNAFTTCKIINRDKDFTADILTFRSHSGLLKEEVIDNVKITRCRLFGNTPILRRLSVFSLFPYLLKNACKYDVFFIYAFTPGLFTLVVLGRLLGKKVFYRPTMYGTDDVLSLVKRNRVLGVLRNFFLKKIDVQIAIQPLIHTAFVRLFPDRGKSVLLPQGVDTDFYSCTSNRIDLRRKMKLPEDKIIILSIGFLIKRKGYDYIFQALRQLKEKNIDFLYLIIGDYKVDSINKNMYEYLEQEMDELYEHASNNLHDKIKFLGRCQRNDVRDYLACADIFILQSKKEGLPNVLLEAMAMGLPSVVSDIPGLNGFLINDGINCFVTKSNDSCEIANQLQMLINSEDLRKKMGDTAQKNIVSNFNAKTYVAEIKRLASDFLDVEDFH
ncbi:MAG: glycosyltransferase family 4 protein [Desulfobacula sp.]|jgi:glycosyltransferase involved in cell wall biosynthesis|uniref:glycosyltransferase family 4 protein n=1 Tax=Desulfobacula sp. TaxID=2593537 RepID=UPI001D73BEA8|nr:glycosyltransferase family 4 protein [Desulfobacula sp.]MBT3487420.1 glycosyltransferase family 4 protein [Desulfobacula sp.]MBT3806948.1 glycosyltransferase family 4 protein [Desulfobacula sp.]MBT4026575.1 glycosyltransferase family 4 protein [Desulfobacula sp.]MBT4201023.1 glycosyltransferase family 4 protein [Desulfobacula sp.]